MEKLIVVVATAALLSGCASIMEGSHQSIAIETPPTTGAICNLSSKEGSWPVTSPGTVTVWFTEGFDTADLNEAKALLDELE
jgi:uncharacterized protein YceK